MTAAVRVRCPATAANLGPGFDALGLALTLANEFELRDREEGFVVTAEGRGAARIPTDPGQNRVFLAYQAGRTALGLRPVVGLELSMRLEVPPGRGLGSSATATVAGLLAAEAVAGAELPLERKVQLAVALEGHPDNVLPCLLGGLCVAAAGRDGPVRFVRHTVPAPPTMVVAIPTRLELATAEMRALLPTQVPFADAVDNVGRVALLLSALVSRRHDLLSAACEDHLHQPYRAARIPGFEAIRAAARAAGAHAVVIAGSGPSLLALVEDGAAPQVAAGMKAVWNGFGVACETLEVGVDEEGARVEGVA